MVLLFCRRADDRSQAAGLRGCIGYVVGLTCPAEKVHTLTFAVSSQMALRVSFEAALHGLLDTHMHPACSVYQLQAIAAELLETFEFMLPEPKPTIRRTPAVIMVPVVEGREDLGFAMPLRISLAK